MQPRWEIQDDILVYVSADGVKHFPRSIDVFSYVFDPDNCSLPSGLCSPQEAMPTIRFSRIGSSIKIRLYINGEKIAAEAFISRRGQEYPVQMPVTGGPDHIIIENQWIYLSENYTQVADLLITAKISNLSSITFSSYIQLRNVLRNYPAVKVIDEVSGHLDTLANNIEQDIPEGLQATLYPYQEIGFKWLEFITSEDCGCILGDEMGLGKTLQIITLFLHRKYVHGGPSLVVAPVSLLENWRREISKFAPELKVLVNHGACRTGLYTDLLNYDIVVISYSSAVTDLSMLYMVKWDLVILDEAQNIKNPSAARTKAVKGIPRRAGIAVTGTPFENHITDIWSIIDYAIPGIIGSVDAFVKAFSDDIGGAESIQPILSSLMIRRKVADVAKDLPEKIIVPQPLIMNDNEASDYEVERQKILNSVDQQSATLASLVKLRMYCTHPSLLNKDLSCVDPQTVSTKYIRLCEILEEIIENGEKTILFTSYTEMFNILEKDMPLRFNIPVYSINGNTPVPKRQEIVDDFSKVSKPALLILNPRAAGTGLNITAANHVIHYNLEWNPALEDQSTARAFRRGQSKTVFVYRLFYVDTVEQIVNEKIEHKRDMSDVAVVGASGELDNRNDILTALLKSPIHKDE